jgi:uncharacterized membrane protein YphA (DoxX/SURF4 family)
MKRTTIIGTIIYLYTILFLYTGISKLMEYDTFKESIADSPILSPVATPVALILPWLEFSLTAMIIIPKWRLKGLYASMILMSLFTIYTTAILLIDKDLPCSCGGIIQQLTWTQHLLFNSAFIVLAIWAIVLQKKEQKQIPWNNRYQTTNLEY